MDAVLNWLWQGGVVAMALYLMLAALDRSRANARYVVCWAAALFVVALPALPSLRAVSSLDSVGAPQSEAIVALPDVWWTSAHVILAAWMLWAGLHIVRLIPALVAIRRARTRSRVFPAHLQLVLPHWNRVRLEGRRATLVVSNSVTSAAVLGWGAPMIAVAPSLVRTLDADDLDRVLIHEWAHVQRHDDVINVLQVMVRVVAGWHPAIWWIDRRLHIEREIACDEITVAITGSPKSYAECLMRLSRVRDAWRAMQTAPAVFTPSGLRARVVKIVSPHRSIAPVWSRTLAAAMVLALGAVSVAVCGLTLVEAAAFAQPFVSSPTLTLSTASDRMVPVAASVHSGTRTERPLPRSARRSPSPQASTIEPPPPSPQSPQSDPEPMAPPAPQEPAAVDSTPAAEADLDATETPAPVVASAPQTPQYPWTAAAAGGAALGRKSKDAGVATAGFFSRFARHVARSF